MWKYYPSVGMEGHNGLDFAAWHGEPIYHCATFDGTMYTEKDNAGGIGVNVISNDPVLNGKHIKLKYWHLKAPVGHDGKVVKLGEQIGIADNTGASSGDHLHFGAKLCDKDGNNLEMGNGYYGAFDPLPYMDMHTDAKSAAEYLFNEAPKMSVQERKEVISQLSIMSQLLNALLELKRRV